MHRNHRIAIFLLTCLLTPSALVAAAIGPLVRTVDLDVGQTQRVRSTTAPKPQ